MNETVAGVVFNELGGVFRVICVSFEHVSDTEGKVGGSVSPSDENKHVKTEVIIILIAVSFNLVQND